MPDAVGIHPKLFNLMIQVALICFHEPEHPIELFLSHLIEHHFIPILELLMQFLMDLKDLFALFCKSK